MKHAILLLMLTLAASATDAAAQNIALGERVPEFKNTVWLDDIRPVEAPMTYIEFFHSSNKASDTSLEQLRNLSDKLGTKLRIIIVTKEPAAKVAHLLRPYLSPRMTVAMDSSGRSFAAFGVTYVPFGVLVDARGRALWMGNSQQMNEKLIQNITR